MEMQNKYIKKAVAVKYKAHKQGANPGHGNQTDSIPQTAYFVRGGHAEKVIELALQNDVPIHKNLELLTQLSNIDFLDNIPDELHAAVAEILSFIYRVNGKQTEAQGAVDA